MIANISPVPVTIPGAPFPAEMHVLCACARCCAGLKFATMLIRATAIPFFCTAIRLKCPSRHRQWLSPTRQPGGAAMIGNSKVYDAAVLAETLAHTSAGARDVVLQPSLHAVRIAFTRELVICD